MDKDIKDFIIESELLNLKQIKEIENNVFKNNINFFDAVLESGFLDQETLSKISAHLVGIPQVSLRDKNISMEILENIPESICCENNILAFENKDGVVSVAFCDVKSLDILNSIFENRSDNLKLFLAEKSDIEQQKEIYKKLVFEEKILKNKNQSELIKKIDDFSILRESDLPKDFLGELLDDKNTDDFIKTLLENAVTSRASFIYFNIGKENLKISFRIFDKKYPNLEIDKDITFSIFSKLKFLADLKINSKENILEGVFEKEILGKKYNLNLSFIKGDFGESLTIEVINLDNEFKADILNLSNKQENYFLQIINKKSNIITIAGDKKLENIKNLYKFLESESKKEYEVYSLESDTLQQLQFVNQVSISKKNNISNIVAKIIKNNPEVIAIDYFTKTSFLMLFKYASFGKKVYLNIGKDLNMLVNIIFDLKLDKGLLVKNFSYFIQNQEFNKLDMDNKKKDFLNKKEISLVNKFLSDTELKSLFIENDLEKEIKKGIKDVPFYKNKKKVKIFKLKKDQQELVNIKGIFNLGLILEKEFLKKSKDIEIKNSINKEIKKKILENGILASFRGLIDIKEVLKYLTK